MAATSLGHPSGCGCDDCVMASYTVRPAVITRADSIAAIERYLDRFARLREMRLPGPAGVEDVDG